MEMATARVMAWACMIIADILAVISLKEAWFGKDIKSGLSTFFGGFIIFPLVVVALVMFGVFHCFPDERLLLVIMLPVLFVVFDIITREV